MKISYLNEFVRLACDLNYVSAAKKLGISQPALSRHMVMLEESVGVKLVDRSTPLSLTPAGKAFLEYAQRILHLVEEAKDAASKSGSSVFGTIRIVIPPTFGATQKRILSAARTFMDSHPNIHIELHDGGGVDSLDALQNGVADCALLTQQIARPSLSLPAEISVLPFCREEEAAWVDAQLPLSQEGMITLEELCATTLIVQSDIDAEKTAASISDDFAQIDLSPTVSFRFARSKEDFLMSITGCGEAVLKPLGYFNNAAVEARDDRVLARIDPPLHVTSFLILRKPPKSDKNYDAMRLFEKHIVAESDFFDLEADRNPAAPVVENPPRK